jgi:hypothetical protein
MEFKWNQGAALRFGRALNLEFVDEVYSKLATLIDLVVKNEDGNVRLTLDQYQTGGALIFAAQPQPAALKSLDEALDYLNAKPACLVMALNAVAETLPKPREIQGEASA